MEYEDGYRAGYQDALDAVDEEIEEYIDGEDELGRHTLAHLMARLKKALRK